MSALPLRISRLALTDLEEIWSYTAEHWSLEQADRYYELILEEIRFICRNSTSGRSMEYVRKGYFASKVKSHLIFYRIVNETLEVVRILHERMDVEGRL